MTVPKVSILFIQIPDIPTIIPDLGEQLMIFKMRTLTLSQINHERYG